MVKDVTDDILNFSDDTEVIDLTADSDDDSLATTEDAFMDDCDYYFCSCGTEIGPIQSNLRDGLCEDCHWFSQLSEDDWRAIFDMHTRFN